MAAVRRSTDCNGPSRAPADDPPMALSGRPLPEHLRRPLAPRRPAGNDPLARAIGQLLRLHPEIDREYRDADLRTMSEGAKRRTLAQIRGRLGIPGSVTLR